MTLDDALTALRNAAEEGRAEGMADYHKVPREYLGVPNPAINDLAKEWRGQISLDERVQLASDLCGQRTADNITENTRGESVGNVGVPLIRPEKVRGMRKWRQIIVVDELDNPIKAKLIPYFKRKRWSQMADKNPYRD